jgi:hypothetical protein
MMDKVKHSAILVPAKGSGKRERQADVARLYSLLHATTFIL